MKNILVILLVSTMLSISALVVSSLQAQNAVYAQADLACESLGGGDGDDGGCGAANEGEPEAGSIVTTAITYLSIVTGIIAVIMMIVGGLKFITSGGDASAVTSARNTIIYAVIGIVIAVLAQVFVQFVIGSFEQQPEGSGNVSADEG